MPLHQCPRCRADVISADAHPTRVLKDAVLAPLFLCRRCYRPAEVELRIAADAAGIPLEPVSVREALALLADLYLDQLGEIDDPHAFLDDDQSQALAAPDAAALDEVRRELAQEPVRDA